MTTMRDFALGPFLSAALLCEKVLEERDGVKSVIRIIDRLTHTVVGHSPPEQMEPFDYAITLLVRFKSGAARGVYPLRVRLTKPSGESLAPLTRNIMFEGEEDRGVDLIANMMLRFDQPGIYWFALDLEDRFLTKIPFRVIYLPQVTQMPISGGDPRPAHDP